MAATNQSERTDAILEIQQLKTYFFLDSGTVKSVNGVDLTLRRNTTLGLVGESGCGKSVMSFSLMRRNPYYWKVDEEGRQLPYLDEVTFQKGTAVALCAILAGDVACRRSASP